MNVRRGDVVSVEWIYSDRTGSKIRPAVVVQGDFLNGKIDDTVLVSITRTSRGASATEAAIDLAGEPNAGLRFPSVVSCNNIATFDQSIILRVMGRLSPAAMQRIERCIKIALELP